MTRQANQTQAAARCQSRSFNRDKGDKMDLFEIISIPVYLLHPCQFSLHVFVKKIGHPGIEVEAVF